MNFIEYTNCKNNNCINEEKKININKKLIEIQQKIITAKSVKTQEKYIKKYNNLEVKKNFISCMINNCKNELLNNFKEMFDFNKNQIVKHKKGTTVSKVIKKSIEICQKLFNKQNLNNRDFKILANNLDNLFYYTSYLVKYSIKKKI